MKKRVRFPQLLRRAGLLALLTGGTLPVLAQNELSNFTATGRGGVVNTFATGYQSLGVNPANLGRSTGVKVDFTIFEAGVGVSSQTASRKYFNRFIFNTEKKFETDAERKEAVANFTGKSAANIDAAITMLGVSFYAPGIGGFALNTRYRMVGQADLNKNAADLLLRGNHADIIGAIRQGLKSNPATYRPPLASKVLDGTRIQISAVQEFNFGYGREIVKADGVELYGGVGIKYLRGIGIMDLSASGGKLSAYSALSPVFDAPYPATLLNAPGFNPKNDGGSAQFPSVGSGVGYDLGLSAMIANKVRLSASVVDLGKMTWKANSLEMVDAPIDTIQDGDYVDGPRTYNFWKSMKLFNVAGLDSTGPFTRTAYKPGGKREVKLPARFRLGVGAEIGEKFAVGFDAQLPFDNKIPGSYKNALVGAGLDYKPIWWLQLSSGLSGGGGFGFGIPLGIAIVRHSYEAGFGTRNMAGWFGDKNPYISFAFGFLRFKIGRPENQM